MIGLFLSMITFLACFFLVKDVASLNFWLIVNAGSQAVYMGSYLAILPRLLPRAKYGQFFTANQIFGFSGVVLAPVLCGWLIEAFHDYRLVFMWCGVCAGLSLMMCALLYRQWRALGGEATYTPQTKSLKT